MALECPAETRFNSTPVYGVDLARRAFNILPRMISLRPGERI